MKRNVDNNSGNIGTVMTALAWIAFMLLVGFFFNDLLQKQRNPNQVLTTEYAEGRVREVTLVRNKFGHYVTSGLVNGHPVVFMLDTGATGVAIPAHLAGQLGIERGRPMQVQTANGIATSYATRLNSVSVGDIELRSVEAGVVPGFKSEEILLGMSFLRHIEFTQRGHTLVLRQYY